MYVWVTRTSETYAGYQKGRQINLKNSDLDYVVENYTDKYDYISGEFNQMMTVKFGGESGSYSLKGVNKDYFHLINFELDKGRFLYYDYLKSLIKTTVIGRIVIMVLIGSKNV